MSATTFPGFMFARLLALSFSIYTTATSNNGGNDNFARHCFVLNRPKKNLIIVETCMKVGLLSL